MYDVVQGFCRCALPRAAHRSVAERALLYTRQLAGSGLYSRQQDCTSKILAGLYYMQLVFRQFRFQYQESSPSRKATESCNARNMPYCRRASHAQTLALNKMTVEQYRYQRYNYRSYYQYIYTQIQLDVRYSRLSVPVQYSSYSIGSSLTTDVPVATCGKVRSLEVLTQVRTVQQLVKQFDQRCTGNGI